MFYTNEMEEILATSGYTVKFYNGDECDIFIEAFFFARQKASMAFTTGCVIVK